MQTVDELIATICKTETAPGHRMVYLQNGANICVGDVNFIGATMWSRIPEEVFSQADVDMIGKTYFANMKVTQDDPFTVRRCNKMFQDSLELIAKSTNWGCANGKKNVVITHHAPFMEGAFKQLELPKSYLYATDLSKHLSGQHIKAWIFGHTHFNDVHTINGTLCVCNQYGGQDHVVRGWNKAFTFNL